MAKVLAVTDDPAIIARKLRKNYGDFVAVDDIDFEVARGECFGFLGPNGAGKTTTMRMIYCASPMGGGTLRILGIDAGDARAERAIKQRIGVVPQEDSLDQDLSVREYLEVFARFYGLNRREARARAVELLDFVQLNERADAKVAELSGGMKRRALIARGLVGDPELVVLDEPTTGLDPQARQNLWERMRELKRRKATLILTTHYMEEAEQLCDRLVIMDRGRIVARGSPRDLIKEHVSKHVVEIRLENGDGKLPDGAEPLTKAAERFELLADRLLLYVDNGEQTIGEAARALPGYEALLRRSTLEDVFLRITGRKLD